MSSDLSAFLSDKCVLITGGTGFVGKALVEKILRSVPDVKTVFLLLRPKSGQTAEKRLKQLLANSVFDAIRRLDGQQLAKVVAVCGDVTHEELGLNPLDRHALQDAVHVVFNCAATIRFDEPLRRALIGCQCVTFGCGLELSLIYERFPQIVSFFVSIMDITPQSVGDLLIEGKTKQVFGVRTDPSLVFVRSKDRITAGDGAKSHEMRGKAVLSTQTNCALFEFLQSVGVPTHFVGRVGGASHPDADRSFVAKNCAMIPIEWVARRVATGSYLKRHANVKEGYRFAPLKLETFFKDDANHDPFWSEESLIGARLEANGLLIDAARVKQMLEMTKTVFEVIERVWQTANHALIDMKIEFGVIDGNGKKEIVVADVIDNDS
ncbi:unnamed protein product, partial [Oppiella nova]